MVRAIHRRVLRERMFEGALLLLWFASKHVQARAEATVVDGLQEGIFIDQVGVQFLILCNLQ
mgnify:CR=1 FL=1